ncbi:MAG: MATE family efflux transporter [Arachnia sp.]
MSDRLGRHVLSLAIPAFGALLAQPLMLLADTAIVGRIGTTELAGLGIGSTVLLTFSGLMIFLAYGSTAVVSRLVGAERRPEALEMGIQSLWLAATIGIIGGTLGWLTVPWLAAWLGADDQVAAQAVSYLRWAMPGLPGMLVMLSATGTFRGFADARTPLWLTVGSAAVNAVLSLVLVFGLGRGIGGAGLGTALAETALGIVAAGIVIRRGRGLRLGLAPSPRLMAHSLAVGTPLLIRTVALRAALLVTTYVAASQGPAALAAHHIVFNVWTLLANALDALAIAGQTVIGTRLGASDAAGARQAARQMTRWALAGGVVLGALVAAGAPLIAAALGPDAEVASIARALLWVAAAGQPLAAYVFLLDGILIGAGDGRYLAGASLVTLASYVPLALAVQWAPTELGVMVGLWLAFAFGFMGSRAALLGLRSRGGRWLREGA